MTNKTLLQLSIVLVIGIALLVIQNLWGRYQEVQPNEYLKVVNALPRDSVQSVTLSQNGKYVELVKQDGEWKVGSKSADPEKLTSLLTALYPSTSPELTATSKELLENLNATETKGVKVILRGNGKETSLIIGKQIGSSTAVAPVTKNEAYKVAKMPGLSANADDWVDLAIVHVDSADIKKLTYLSKGKTYTLSQQEGKQWSFEGDTAAVNSDAVNTFLMKLNPLEAKELAYTKKQAQYNLKLPEFVWTITDSSGNEISLEFFKGTNDYLVKKGTEDFYVVPTTAGDEFVKSKEKFVASGIK